MRKILLMSMSVLLVAIFVVPVSVSAQDDVTVYPIGAAQPFSGPLGSFGEDFVRGIELAVAQMNDELANAGVPIQFELSTADTEGTPDGALEAVQTLVQTTGAQVIVGPLSTSEVLGAKQFADDNGIVIIAPASSGVAGAIPGDNVFRVMNPPDTFAARAFSQIAVARGYENIAILQLDDPFGNGLTAEFTRNFEAAGGGEISVITYVSDAPDLSPEVTALSAEVASLSESGTTAVFCICFLADAQKILQNALFDTVLGSVEWMGIENLANPELLADEAVADFLRNANFVSVSVADNSTPLTQKFIDDFTAMHGSEPGPFTNFAFDAANIAMLSVLVTDNDGEAMASMVPFIANHYIGTQVQTFLDENGDQAIAFYGLRAVAPDEADFIEIGRYDGSTDTVTLNE